MKFLILLLSGILTIMPCQAAETATSTETETTETAVQENEEELDTEESTEAVADDEAGATRDYSDESDVMQEYEETTTASDDFESREAAWNHDYSMLNKGTYNCKYLNNYLNETKEPIDSSTTGEMKIRLVADLPAEPQKIFLQVLNLDTMDTFGMIALRENDNKTFVFDFNLFSGRYIVDYIIAEGDTDNDFYVEPEIFSVSVNSNNSLVITLKRQSQIIVNGEAIAIEDIESALEDNEQMQNGSETISQSVYDASSAISEKEEPAQETYETVEEEQESFAVPVQFIIAIGVTILSIIGFVLYNSKRKS